MMLFVGFIIIVVFVYNRRQLINRQQNLLKEAEHQNQLLQKELDRQKSIEKERERISHDMHDDLGAGISAIKLQAEFLKQKLPHDSTLQQDIEELLKTSQEMNLSMREMLWSLNTKNDTLESFIQYISAYTDNFLRKANIAYSIQTVNIQSDTIINAPIRRNLLLCIKEAINNVYKHSNAANLLLVFTQHPNTIIIDIIDDGKGLPTDAWQGYGIANMQRRVQNCTGIFEIIHSEKGLRIRLQIQLS